MTLCRNDGNRWCAKERRWINMPGSLSSYTKHGPPYEQEMSRSKGASAMPPGIANSTNARSGPRAEMPGTVNSSCHKRQQLSVRHARSASWSDAARLQTDGTPQKSRCPHRRGQAHPHSAGENRASPGGSRGQSGSGEPVSPDGITRSADGGESLDATLRRI